MLFLTILAVYLTTGLVFAVAFVVRGFRRILPEAAGTRLRVRLLWAPGAMLLWPCLVRRWLSGSPGGVSP